MKSSVITFGFIYALPGYTKPDIHEVTTEKAKFVLAAVDYTNLETTAEVAKDLVKNHRIDALELCGGLANADTIKIVKDAVENAVPVGAVFYGPECRRPLVDLLGL